MDDAHSALAVVEAQVGPLLDVLPVPLLVADDHGIVQRVNPSAAYLLGDKSSVVGRSVYEVLPLEIGLRTRRTLLRDGDQELWLYALPDEIRRPVAATSDLPAAL